MQTTMKAKVYRYYSDTKHYDIAVYWTADPDRCPHDMDLLLPPKEWRRFSGLRSPKKDHGMDVSIAVELLTEFKE